MNEAQLLEKLRLIEALIGGGATAGERGAAEAARNRILAKLAEAIREDPPVQHRFSMPDLWSRRLFLALLRRYDLRPYRRYRQRRTTVMVRVPKSFVDETLWPEFRKLSDALEEYLSEVTDRVIQEVFQSDGSEAAEVKEAPELTAGIESEAADPVPPPRSPGSSSEKSAEKKPGSEGKKRDWRIGRNAPCPCQSGKKFKRCCGR
jgi:hypothetical protein